MVKVIARHNSTDVARRALPSAVAELLVNFQIGSSDDIKQLIVDSTRLSALFHVLVFTRNTQEV